MVVPPNHTHFTSAPDTSVTAVTVSSTSVATKIGSEQPMLAALVRRTAGGVL